MKNGFTIVEVLVATAIFVLAIGLVFNIYVLAQKFYQRGETEAELLQNGRITLERISRDIRQAAEMVTALPQTPDSLLSPPPSAIEFQDGHQPSPYDSLGSDYYYIRYYLATSTGPGEMHRQYRVYCFDDCSVCATYYRWNDTRIQDGETVVAHACNLEDYVVGEYFSDIKFWGAGLVNISISLTRFNYPVNLKSAVSGRNL
ncbi:hypothetical protein COU03_02125 [bacterium (Candidatus Gribaldobacteria) CG10_big_fil_rev_8_21_14_0_10_41_12]|uniref:Type II secretion system protein J n=1 Tax=bacterium (Candidatus Gribaldobacteria) CG10_big_fil_rev_8_21_14_0_10_41_12 TaxID=2014277 RepID=A0A2H0UZD0_9BACT|nr:MAG: hypothetical protein COU03_02125 [bacterium (Candidatus Gribaldobacteria) CG10_big_fil_rev_8_21_14_0_10_41_12]